MISLKQLQYALAIEKTLHFKKAAEHCHISQSALSTAVSELESQLDLQIFERNNKTVMVTPVGKEVLARARNIMLEVNELEHIGDDQTAPLSYPLTIGIIPTIAPYLLPKLFPALTESYPDTKINVIEEQSAVLIEMIRAGEIDTAILALPYPHQGLLALEFWQEDFYWISPKDDKRATKKKISSKEISEGNLMLLKNGHCLKDHILNVCKLAGDESLGATSLNTLIQMVQAKQGTTLIPEMALEQLVSNNDKLTAVQLDEPSPHRKLAFIIRPNYTRYSSVEALAAVCKLALE
jgi:LysR family transcriptional regulator, hydrogen peroxide-inducible genes activator